jgi:hypothetical protein
MLEFENIGSVDLLLFSVVLNVLDVDQEPWQGEWGSLRRQSGDLGLAAQERE